MKQIRFLLPFILVLAACFLGVGAAQAEAYKHQPVLHVGNTGLRVRNLQWLLAGHRPSKRRIKTYVGPIDGRFEKGTARGVRDMKYLLGWPDRAVDSLAGDRFIETMLGKRRLPLAYQVRRTKRLAYLKRIAAERARSSCAVNVLRIARGEVGVQEYPWGSNSGRRVRDYQSSTGAYYAPWCVSFVQWVFKNARVHSPRAWSGAIGDNTAGAFYLAYWARNHGWLRATPKPAFIVVFLDRLGHVGIVESVSRWGFTSIEGNASNQVLRRYHPFGARPEVFVRVPGCETG